ncbi:unnamed protein product [Chrysoparadoxa australica]
MQRPAHPIFGSALEVTLPEGAKKGDTFEVKIGYHTTPQSTAVQWLPAEQTAGLVRPYLFTQCQAIHARSLLPCQDCPSAKCTYSSSITVPNWSVCLMSALSTGSPVPGEKPDTLVYSFNQPVPTPSYLIAIAVGDLVKRDVSVRCSIWAEPSVVEKAAYDFSQTEDFLTAAEELTCPYVWTRYDVLCLPPSFPYGGMENVCLTFVTPTLLTGDKSLASVVAHEISHSWTGNLITNETWQHFWLNEGWTMWLQRKIEAKVCGDPRFFDFSAQIGWSNLKDSVDLFEAQDKLALTALVPPLEGVDPDDAFSSVPYEKGFALLYDLQSRIGISAFEAFAKAYIEGFKFKTITSEGFRDFFCSYCKEQGSEAAIADVDWETWFHAVGMPVRTPDFDSSLCTASWDLADAWLEVHGGDKKTPANTKVAEFAGWASMQKVVFLERVSAVLDDGGEAIPEPLLKAMDECYGFSLTANSEIKFRWHMLCLRSHAFFVVPAALEFVTSQGRMKFTRPLYRELNNHIETRGVAKDTFLKYSSFYHPICRTMVSAWISIS